MSYMLCSCSFNYSFLNVCKLRAFHELTVKLKFSNPQGEGGAIVREASPGFKWSWDIIVVLVKAASLSLVQLYVPVISSLERWKQENLDFKASFSYKRSCLNNKTKQYYKILNDFLSFLVK